MSSALDRAPVIRLTVDSMKYSIVSYLGEREKELAQAVKDVVDAFDIHAEVAKQVREVLPGEIARALRSAIHGATCAALEEQRPHLESMVRTALREMISRM